jgi:hypothetical protein
MSGSVRSGGMRIIGHPMRYSSAHDVPNPTENPKKSEKCPGHE